MAKVIPFCGLRYNPEKVHDLSLVMAPPYDIISAEEQEFYYKLHPYNIIRLILGKEYPDDNEANNRYVRAAKDFRTWREMDVLIRDKKPSFYFYRQEFSTFDNKSIIRDGFIALVRLEDFASGIVVPHEKTLSKPKQDRLNLFRACRANFSCVFSLYQDPAQKTLVLLRQSLTTAPYLDITDRQGCRHQLWQVIANGIAEQIGAVLNNEKIFIADGHHRYETALTFRNEMQRRFPDAGIDAPFHYVMMYLTPMESEGLVIFPYHRAIDRIRAFEPSLFEESLKRFFHVEKISFANNKKSQAINSFKQKISEQGKHAPTFGFIIRGAPYLMVISIKDGIIPEKISATDALDVSILERYVFNHIMGIDSKNLREQKSITYFHDMEEGFSLVANNRYQLAIILNPTRVQDIKTVSASGDKMPQKSTYFYPKVLSGPVIRSIDPQEPL